MAERGVAVNHAKIHRRLTRYSLELLERFNQLKRPVTGKWHIGETAPSRELRMGRVYAR